LKFDDVFGARLWQDAENRVYLIKELDRRTGQVNSFFSPEISPHWNSNVNFLVIFV